MTPLVAIAPGDQLLTDTAPEADETGLTFLRCRWCHSASAATGMLCPVCGSSDLNIERSCGTGLVQRLLRPTRRGLHPGRPYLVVLDEGFSVQAAIIGGLPGAVPVGSRVKLETADPEGRLLTFRVCPR